MQINLPDLLKRPLFIVFEGVDGIGKSTQVELLKKHLEEEGFNVSTTAEAKGTPLADVIRAEYLSGKRDVNNLTNAFSFSADRYDRFTNTNGGVIQRLKSGQSVIADRWIHSSMVYSAIQYTDYKEITSCMQLMKDVNMPLADRVMDVAYLLEFHLSTTEISELVNRINERSDKPQEIYESRDQILKQESLYNHAIRVWTQNRIYVKVSVNESAEEVHNKIWDYLTKRILHIATIDYEDNHVIV